MINTLAIDRLINEIEGQTEDIEEAQEILEELHEALSNREIAMKDLDDLYCKIKMSCGNAVIINEHGEIL